MITIFSVNTDKKQECKYLIYLATALSQCSDYLIACTGPNVEEDVVFALNKICNRVYICDSYYNAVKWKYVLLNKLSRKFVMAAESLLLIDDSNFGPIRPFEEIFSQRNVKDLDFWGLTEHSEMKLVNGEEWPRFLQSYFLIINQSLLKSEYFWSFFENMAVPKSFEEASSLFEFTFTHHFEELGFSWRAMINTKNRESKNSECFMSFILFDLYRLISEQGFPFVPKFIFDLDPTISQNFHLGDDIKKTMDYIEKQTNYNISLIYSNLLSRMNLYDMQVRMGLNYIPKETDSILDKKIKTAIFSFLFYEDLILYSVSKILDAPESCELYIATDNEKKAEVIQEICRQKKPKRRVNIVLHQGRGRDISALLVTFKKYLMNYDVICFIHDKKSEHFPYCTVGEAFNESIWEGLLSNKEYINAVINLFIEKPYLGFVCPPMVEHSIYFHTAIDAWTICYEQTKKIANKLGIIINVDKNKNPVSLGSAFWCRTTALEPIFKYPFTIDDFPEEPMPVDGTINHGLERIFPYIAQCQGYSSGTITTREISEAMGILYKYKLNSILQEIDMFEEIDTTTFWTTINTLKTCNIKRKKRKIGCERRTAKRFLPFPLSKGKKQ